MSAFLSEPQSVYAMIQELNEKKLSNRERWVISEHLRYPSKQSTYDPEKQYAIWPNTYELGRLYELRQVMELFFHKMPRNETTKKYHRLNTIMTELVDDIIEEGYTYRYHDPNEPKECFCYYPELNDEYGQPEICRNCAEYTPPPVSDETTVQHFHIVPYPQRLHMRSTNSKYLWVLAFLLEGYEYDFTELAYPTTASHREYFWFYAQYGHPSKQELRDYQELRTLYDERFDAPPPSSSTFVRNSSVLTFPTIQFAQRHVHLNWWEAQDVVITCEDKSSPTALFTALLEPHIAEVAEQIHQLNQTLPNQHKWSICTSQLKDPMLIWRTGTFGEKYDETVEYNIECSHDDLRKIAFLREYVETYYTPTSDIILCSGKKRPMNPSPMEFRHIQLNLKFCKHVINRGLAKMLENITPEQFVLAMLISTKFKYQWETISYKPCPPVYFRFLAKNLFKPDPERSVQFMEIVQSRYGNLSS